MREYPGAVLTTVQRNPSLLTDWSETGSYCGEARLLLAIGSQRPQLTSLFSLATNTLRTFPCNLMKIFLLPNRKKDETTPSLLHQEDISELNRYRKWPHSQRN